ncbi:hypothetical protein [Accumulibacter sp.]|uniref:hypothetical protein n=1 Tax=Accumulibacter sp. TaxID=2053492 RepID=UPI0028C443F4|nr:hypothetical protein [Accumulibacter sp.]
MSIDQRRAAEQSVGFFRRVRALYRVSTLAPRYLRAVAVAKDSAGSHGDGRVATPREHRTALHPTLTVVIAQHFYPAPDHHDEGHRSPAQ